MSNAEQAVKNITVDDVISEIQFIDEQIKNLQKKRTDFESSLNEFIGDDVAKQLAGKDYGCGTATVDTNNYKVKYVVSKRVKWDQDGLKLLAEQIAASGEDPYEYIKVDFDVSETAYKNWPSKYQKAFEPHRAVESSKPKVSFERKE